MGSFSYGKIFIRDVFHNAVSILPPRLLIAISSANRDLSRARLGTAWLLTSCISKLRMPQGPASPVGLRLMGWKGETYQRSVRGGEAWGHGSQLDLAVVGGTVGLNDL